MSRYLGLTFETFNLLLQHDPNVLVIGVAGVVAATAFLRFLEWKDHQHKPVLPVYAFRVTVDEPVNEPREFVHHVMQMRLDRRVAQHVLHLRLRFLHGALLPNTSAAMPTSGMPI